MAQLPVSIVGAGISGLVLGQCLLLRGIHAVIFEKASSSAHRNNHCITLHARAYQPLLKVLDLDETKFKQRVAVDPAINVEGRLLSGSSDDSDRSSFRAHRGRFERLLAQGLEIAWEHEVESVTLASAPLRRAASLRVRNGGDHPSSVIAGADGPHSQVRTAIAAVTTDMAPLRVLPFATYNGRRLFTPSKYEATLGPFMRHTTVLEQRISHHFLQLALSDSSDEGVLVSYTYSRPARAREEGDRLYRPQRPKDAAEEIPEELFTEIASLRDQMDEPFRAIFDCEVMREDRLLNWLMRAAPLPLICDENRCTATAAAGGVVLLGDAVHVEPILGGEGANVAIEDGMRLAETLFRSGEEPDLLGFYRLRREEWERSMRNSERRLAGLHGL